MLRHQYEASIGDGLDRASGRLSSYLDMSGPSCVPGVLGQSGLRVSRTIGDTAGGGDWDRPESNAACKTPSV